MFLFEQIPKSNFEKKVYERFGEDYVMGVRYEANQVIKHPFNPDLSALDNQNYNSQEIPENFFNETKSYINGLYSRKRNQT